MLIFYTDKNPCVIIDALSNDDRFTRADILSAVAQNTPSDIEFYSESIGNPKIYSCEYSAEFSHIGIPLGEGMKTKFSAMIKSAPGELVSAFSPKFLTSSKNLSDMGNALGKIANPQTWLTYGVMVVQIPGYGISKKTVTRSFIAYAAPVEPDAFGTTTTMFVSGAMVDDILLKTECAFQIDKKTSLQSQLSSLLSKNGWTGTFNASQASNMPATEILFHPMKFYDLIDEICLQNKMIPIIDEKKKNITFNSANPGGAPKSSNNYPSFSFLGYKGNLSWGLSVENYSNIKFKTMMFDPQLFQGIIIYNDIYSAFFGGLTKQPGPPSIIGKTIDAYSAFVIRYIIKWSREDLYVELTASNNWIMAMFRVDGLLESSIYNAVLK